MSFAAELRGEGDELFEAQHAHPFVRGIGDGTLDEAKFRWYIEQDYLFLIDYGRTLSYAAARAPRLDWMARFAELAQATLGEEMELHRSLAREWGISALENVAPAPATSAYTDFLLRVAAAGEFAELAAALLPCMAGYAEIGERLEDAGLPAHPGYAAWIQTYSGGDFQALAAWCCSLVDVLGADASERERELMRRAFLVSAERELAFWDAAWQATPGVT